MITSMTSLPAPLSRLSIFPGRSGRICTPIAGTPDRIADRAVHARWNTRVRRMHTAPALLALCGLLLAAATPSRAGDARAGDYVTRSDVQAFVRERAGKDEFDAVWALEALANAQMQPRVRRLVMPARGGSAAKDWGAYRARFVEPARIAAGVQWWQENAAALARAEAQYGVPASIVAGIVGVETYYGRVMGNFRVIDALATLAFDFPAGRSDRSGFYQEQLAAFLRWTGREQREPASVVGSYAGAIGLPQFMPSSILDYAVDFDGDGRIDLDNDGADVVGSVAHYLATFGWQRGMPAYYDASPPEDRIGRAVLLAPDIVPSFTAQQMIDRGATLGDAARRHEGPMALVQVFNGDRAPSFYAGTKNFYAITRYNQSSYYALAVVDLGQAVGEARARQLAGSTASPAAAAPAASAP